MSIEPEHCTTATRSRNTTRKVACNSATSARVVAPRASKDWFIASLHRNSDAAGLLSGHGTAPGLRGLLAEPTTKLPTVLLLGKASALEGGDPLWAAGIADRYCRIWAGHSPAALMADA